MVAEVREHFGERVYETVIPRTVRLSEAPSFGRMAFSNTTQAGAGQKPIAPSRENFCGGTMQRTPLRREARLFWGARADNPLALGVTQRKRETEPSRQFPFPLAVLR